MTINKETALKLWDHRYGAETKFVRDCYGTYMYRDDYGIDPNTTLRIRPGNDGKKYFYGWNIDHIKPSSKGGTDDPQNLELVQYHNNGPEKSDDLSYEIDKVKYHVVKDTEYTNGYGIVKTSTGKRVDWKASNQFGCFPEAFF